MSPNVDLALYDRDGQLACVAEVKNKLGTSRDWAAKLRRNILAHGGFRSVDFFLLVTPDRLYLWRGAGDTLNVVEPTYDVDARPILEPYFAAAGVDPAHVSGSAFEMVVATWLADLVRPGGSAEKRPTQRWLSQSGFLDAVRNGRVEYEAAA